MRSQAEVQAAHEIVREMIGALAGDGYERNKTMLSIMCALCWVLEDEHDDGVEALLSAGRLADVFFRSPSQN